MNQERKCDNLLAAYLEYSDSSESPTSYHIWSFLTVVAACLRRQVWVDMGYFRIYPNLYTVLVGPAGKCRKSVAINTAMGLVADIPSIKVSADSITREALIRALAQSSEAVELAPNELYLHNSLTIVSKELSVFLGHGNHDLLALLTDLFDNPDKWEYRTKNQGVDKLENVWLNMLAASTPDWLVGSLPITAIGGGYTSRVLFVVEDKARKKVPRPQLSARQKELKEMIKHDLNLMSMMVGEFRWTKAAEEFFDRWYESISYGNFDSRFWGYIERKHLHLIKVATIVAAMADTGGIIDVVHFQTALKLIDSIEVKMTEAFGNAGRSPAAPDIGELANFIRLSKEITHTDLMRNVWRDVAPDMFDKAIKMLMEMKMISARVSQKGTVYTWIKEDNK